MVKQSMTEKELGNAIELFYIRLARQSGPGSGNKVIAATLDIVASTFQSTALCLDEEAKELWEDAANKVQYLSKYYKYRM